MFVMEKLLLLIVAVELCIRDGKVTCNGFVEILSL